MKTVEITITFGTTAGYGEDINERAIGIDVVGSEVQALAALVLEETGIYISGNLFEKRSIYHTDWGCPKGGEKVFEFSAVANLQFISSKRDFIQAARKMALKIKNKFNQSTVYFTWAGTNLDYLTDESREDDLLW